MNGLFVTFEGIEGCGKSTQAALLKDYLQQKNIPVFLTREPGGPKIAEAIRAILLSNDNTEMLDRTEVLLYMASRSQHTGQWIIPQLKQGKVVISDRYYDSTFAYQGAARKIKRNIIDILTGFSTFGLKPEITFLIDLPAELGLSRIKKQEADRLEQESLDFHRKVRNGFLSMANAEKKRYIILDGLKPVEAIHQDIVDEIEKRLRKAEYEIK